LVQVGADYFLDNVSTGVGPELTLNGSPVVAGQFPSWNPVAAEQMAGGYFVAMKATSGSQFIIWNVDSSGAYVTNGAPVSGSSSALESAETSFHQDLNGDGAIGVPSGGSSTTVIESFGSTGLVQVGADYFLDNVSTGVGPELTLNGSPVVAGQFPGWNPVAAEQMAGGYLVAMKATSGSQFIIWNVDSSGAYVTNGALVSGSSSALESAETSFHQDLNGDGSIGVPSGGSSTTVIESFGSTSLVQVGADYFLDNVSTGVGPELTLNGSPVVAGQFPGWNPVAAEQVSGGYLVAMKATSGSQFIIWNVDSNGAYVTNGAPVSGSSSALESAETSFHQDLNGDGAIGVPSGGSSVSGNSSALESAETSFHQDLNGGGATGIYAALGTMTADSFVFHPAVGGGFVAINDRVGSAGILASDHQWPGQAFNVVIDTATSPANDVPIVTDPHIAELHANGFIIH
jgi:serralysin